MATDQISFYDESLKKQIEGSFVSDGKEIHVSSVYGTKSFPYTDLGACIDYNAQVLFVKKLLSELARDPGSRRENVGQASARVALHGHLCSPARNAIAVNDTESIIVSEPKSSLI